MFICLWSDGPRPDRDLLSLPVVGSAGRRHEPFGLCMPVVIRLAILPEENKLFLAGIRGVANRDAEILTAVVLPSINGIQNLTSNNGAREDSGGCNHVDISFTICLKVDKIMACN